MTAHSQPKNECSFVPLFPRSVVPSFPVSVKHAPPPRFHISLFPQTDRSQRGRAGYLPQFVTLELRAATFWGNLPSCPAPNADADCKFFVLKISALKFLKTADLLENPTPQIAENRRIVRSPPRGGDGGRGYQLRNTCRSLTTVLCSLFSVLCSLFSVLCSLFSVPCSLFSDPCSLFPVPCSLLHRHRQSGRPGAQWRV